MKIKSISSTIILLVAVFCGLVSFAQEKADVSYNVDTHAQMPADKQAISDFIYANLVYPSDAVGSGISGMVITEFIVEVDGTISNIKVTKGLNALIDAEAVRVIGLIPGKWTPAKVEGVSVRSLYSIPVLFSDPGK
ncbi:MAG: energy transducer TonB [Bacteroidales bacterium]|nr:energy transducer TonB [Bacteroidales bacterium]MDD4684625.1 energy transducer TonB [Bacteroidales bacterium]